MNRRLHPAGWWLLVHHAESLGGVVEIDSKPGQGTTSMARLPLRSTA